VPAALGGPALFRELAVGATDVVDASVGCDPEDGVEVIGLAAGGTRPL
jgi:hypothetical protein